MYVFRGITLWLLAAVLCADFVQAGSVVFEADVRPIFKAQCFHCHGENGTSKGGLDMRLRKLLLKGGKHGGAIVPA